MGGRAEKVALGFHGFGVRLSLRRKGVEVAGDRSQRFPESGAVYLPSSEGVRRQLLIM